MLRRLSRVLEFDTSEFRIKQRNYDCSHNDRPRPVYTSTALQIGLLDNINVPSLIPSLLPPTYNAYIARFLKRWLLYPPPYKVADDMRSLCDCLYSNEVPIPKCNPVPLGKVISLLYAKQCNAALFRDISTNIKVSSSYQSIDHALAYPRAYST